MELPTRLRNELMISERKKLILATIIEEYVKTVQPVSSGCLVEKYEFDISPATVRHEMAELEEDGFIYQPHTSAGRVPTELAYELLLPAWQEENRSKALKPAESKALEQLFRREEAAYKQTAKAIAELSHQAVFWAFHKNDLYYTGLSNLFGQPEFRQLEIVSDVSVVIDRLEDLIDDNFERLPAGEQVLIGSNNPFGNFLSAVLVKYQDNRQTGLFGILGPMRMDYARNIALVRFIKNKFI